MSTVLDIELLRTFHAVARLGRFRAAAELVSKSPAAVSIHIQRLEAIAGGRLFHRDNQAVTLTALGKRLLSSTGEVLKAHDRVLGEIHGKALAGRVVLGIPDEYAAHVIHDILPGFSAASPNLILEVRTAPSFKLRDHVARGKLDLAVVVQPLHKSRSKDMLAMTTPVWAGGPSFVMDTAAPLPLALYAEPCPYRAAMTAALDAAGRKWRVILDSASTQAIKACVGAGLAVTLLDRASVDGAMRVLDGLPAVMDHEIVLMRGNRAGTAPAIDLLAATLRQQFRL